MGKDAIALENCENSEKDLLLTFSEDDDLEGVFDWFFHVSGYYL